MTENNGVPFAPIFIINLRTIFSNNIRHFNNSTFKKGRINILEFVTSRRLQQVSASTASNDYQQHVRHCGHPSSKTQHGEGPPRDMKSLFSERIFRQTLC